MTLGLALIARNEEAALPALLASVAGAFDQVALLDTGSTDGTVAVFEQWAEGERLPLGHRVGRFEWRDDFAAARNAADALLETDWLANADADDVIDGAERLRNIAECATGLDGLVFQYEYVAAGMSPLHVVVRERLVRRGRGRWEGRLHERLVVDGPVDDRPADWALWAHRGRSGEGTARNLRIARRWAEEEPENQRAVAVLAREEAMIGHGC